MTDNSTLFVNLLKWTPDHYAVPVRENFLTEVIAGILMEDPVFAREFADLLFEDRNRLRPRGVLVGVATQRSHYGRGTGVRSQIDLQLEYPDARIAVEVKIGSPEGTSGDGRRQLESYCRLPSIYAATMVSGYLQRGEYTSLGPKYLRPKNGRGYFLWAEVQPLLVAGARRRTAPALHRAALGLFEHLNFEPHHKSVGDLNDPNKLVRAANQERFRSYWKETYAMLIRIGAKPSPPRTNAAMYTFNTDRRAWKIWFDPRHVPGSLRVWFNLHHRTQVQRLIRDLRKATSTDRILIFAPKNSTHPAVDMRIPYQVLFPRSGAEQTRGRRLASVLRPLVEAAG